VGGLFGESVGEVHATLSEGRAEGAVLFAQEVRHLNVKESDGEANQQACKFHEHVVTLGWKKA